jgi:hypothetical protein
MAYLYCVFDNYVLRFKKPKKLYQNSFYYIIKKTNTKNNTSEYVYKPETMKIVISEK